MSDGQTWAAAEVIETKPNGSNAMTSPIEVNRPGVPSLNHETEALDRQSEMLLQLADAAEQWWHGKMPSMSSRQQHLDNPAVNCVGTFECELAQAIASWIVITRNPKREQSDDDNT